MTAQAHRSDGEARVHLTPAESDVLAFLPTHLTVEGIAARLGRSRSTVKTHLAHIYGKFGVTGRMAAVDRAWELGLLAEPGGHQVQIASMVAEPRPPGRAPSSETQATTIATKER